MIALPHHLRPSIGVTGPIHARRASQIAARRSLEHAGARPVRLFPGCGIDLSQLDGLVISGGSDVDPVRYGEPRVPGRRLAIDRDRYESLAYGTARARQLPVLGICRGAQLINVLEGGSLHRHLRDRRRSHRKTPFPNRRVSIDEQSELARLVERSSLRVNTLHDQGMAKIGLGLRVVAWDADGVVQAIESTSPWVLTLGVQWHPEYLGYLSHQRALFRGFVDNVARRRKFRERRQA